MKVLVRVALGCGVLLLLGAGVAGVWLFRMFSLTQEASRQQQLQQQALRQLEERYPFTPPPPGAVLALSEERLADYLSVRESSLPALKVLESRTVALQEEQAKRKGSPGLGAAMEASGTLLELAVKAQVAYLDNLEQYRMSPSEFRALTQLVYELHEEGLTEEKERFRAGERMGVEKALAELQARMKDDTLTQEERSALEVQESQYEAWLEMLEKPSSDRVLSEEAQATLQANKELVKKHRLRIAKATDSGFDSFIHAYAGGEGGRQEVPGGPTALDAQ
jgi:hypothetical protein